MLIANMMFLAPFGDLQKAVLTKHLNDLNPTPFAIMVGNCYGWTLYGILRNNFWVYFANAPGLLIAVWLNLGAVKLLYQQHHHDEMRKSFIERYNKDDAPSTHVENAADITKDLARRIWDVTSQTTPAKMAHEKLVMIVVVIWMAVSSLVGFAGSTNLVSASNWPSHAINTAIVGYVVNVNLVFFYGAPLSTIWKVLSQKNTNTIHIPTLVTNTLNGTFWFAYGLAIQDWFIAVPNGMGAALGVVQVILLVLFPRTTGKDEIQVDDNDIVLSTDQVIKAVMETDDLNNDPEQAQEPTDVATSESNMMKHR
jgi:solute carrier family 50 protein (sugar transporter)